MSTCALSFDELLAYNTALAADWRKWFAANPAALDLPCDVMNTGTVRLLVQHIVAAELRYGQQLAGETATAYGDLPQEAEAMFGVHDRAIVRYQRFVEQGDSEWWEEIVNVQTRSAGVLRATRRSFVLHAMLHSVRHWAQLATITRKAGFPSVGWQDYLIYKLVPQSEASIL